MGSAPSAPSARPKWVIWTARVLSALSVLFMLFSASLKLVHAPGVVEAWVKMFGFQESTLTAIGLVELACAILYAVPRTSVLGAVLVTGYLGGAIATHVRLGQPDFLTPLFLGVVVWAGIWLREPRLPELLPLRKTG
jgi:hypothetical protein